MPCVEGKVTECKLDDYSGVDGGRVYKANIEINYEYE